MKAAAAEAVGKEEGKAGALRAKSEREEGRSYCTLTTAGTPHSTMSHSTMSSQVSSPAASGYSGTAGFCWEGCSSSGGGREAEDSIGGIQTEHQAAAAQTSDTQTNGHNDSRESTRRWLR